MNEQENEPGGSMELIETNSVMLETIVLNNQGQISTPSSALSLDTEQARTVISLRNRGVSKEQLANHLGVNVKGLGKTITKAGYYWDIQTKQYRPVSEKPPVKRKSYQTSRPKKAKRVTLVLSPPALTSLSLIELLENREKSEVIDKLLVEYGESRWPSMMINSTVNVKSKVIKLSKK